MLTMMRSIARRRHRSHLSAESCSAISSTTRPAESFFSPQVPAAASPSLSAFHVRPPEANDLMTARAIWSAFEQPPTDRGWSRIRPAVLEFAIEKATVVIETEQRRRKAPALFCDRYHLDQFRHLMFSATRSFIDPRGFRCTSRHFIGQT